MANYDIIGNIAIIKFKTKEGDKKLSKEEKIKAARDLIALHKNVVGVFEKIDKVKGRLRTFKVKHLIGEKGKIAIHMESGCKFKLDIEKCYFSPRMANDRVEISKLARKNKAKKILVMFSGIGPYPIVIAKQNNQVKKIIAIELGKECCNYAKKNSIMNKTENKIEISNGDVKKIIPKLVKRKEKFDFIVMARPNLKEIFLKEALNVSKKNTIIAYHGFWKEAEKDKEIKKLEKEAKKVKRKIKILNVKEIGDIAPYEHRYRVEMKVC